MWDIGAIETIGILLGRDGWRVCFYCEFVFVVFGLFIVERVRWSMMVWFTVKAAMQGRSVNRAARMVRGLDPDCWFC